MLRATFRGNGLASEMELARSLLRMHGPETEQEVLMRIDAALRYSNRLEADFWRRILEAVKRLAR